MGKKNGGYYADDHLMLSTEEHTDSFSTKLFTGSPVKEVRIIRKMSKKLYSNKTYFEIAPHHWKMHSVIIYNESYRIIKFQDMLVCDFILKK